MVSSPSTSHRAEQDLGPSITVDGEVRWVSGSLVVKWDPQSDGGCPARAWWNSRGVALGLCDPEPDTGATRAGTDVHAEIERRLKTGAACLGPVALAGRHMIPEPGAPGLHVEQPIIEGGNGQITRVILRAAGVPYAGHLDLYDTSGTWLDGDGELRQDPPDTFECRDWKTTSDLKWAKTSEQVANAVQMTGYAMAGFAMWPQMQNARLSHVYFSRDPRRRGALLSTALRPRERVERRWEYVQSVVRQVVDWAREPDPSLIPVNTQACHSYGRLCPRYGSCPRGQAATTGSRLDSLLGPRLADAINRNIKEKSEMGLLKDKKTAPAAATTVDDLIAEETAAREAEHAPEARKIPGTQPTPAFREAWDYLSGCALGTPTLTGLCADMLLTWRQDPAYTDSRVEGVGKLAKLDPVSDPIKLAELAKQVRAKLEKSAAKTAPPVAETRPAVAPPVDLLPPDAPPSKPALAADPVEGLDNAKARELEAARGATPAQAVAKLQEVSKIVDTAFGTSPPATPVDAVIDYTATEAAPEKVEARIAAVEAASAKVVSTGPEPQDLIAADKASPEAKLAAAESGKAKRVKTPVAAPKQTAVSIYVDCAVEGVELAKLDDYVKIASDALCAAWGCRDVRLAGRDTDGGFGKGQAVLEAACVANPPPPGAYHVDTRSNPLTEGVAVALRAHCLATGGVFVRGVR